MKHKQIKRKQLPRNIFKWSVEPKRVKHYTNWIRDHKPELLAKCQLLSGKYRITPNEIYLELDSDLLILKFNFPEIFYKLKEYIVDEIPVIG